MNSYIFRPERWQLISIADVSFDWLLLFLLSILNGQVYMQIVGGRHQQDPDGMRCFTRGSRIGAIYHHVGLAACLGLHYGNLLPVKYSL